MNTESSEPQGPLEPKTPPAPAAPLPIWNRWPRRLLWAFFGLLVLLFLALNGIAFLHARAITHYAPVDVRSTRLREVRSWSDKARLVLLGATIRRMENRFTPAEQKLPYSTVNFPGGGGQRLEAWVIPAPEFTIDPPTVLMFPGYGGSKDTLRFAAAEFHEQGCAVWQVDFGGIGGSEGRTTTLGWREAEDVAAAVKRLGTAGHGPVVLFGTSMGSVAILTAIHRGLVAPDALILECPFDRLSHTIGHRIQLLGLPEAPLGPMITFWIGVQNGYSGLNHNPAVYARDVRCPTLVMRGENDPFVHSSDIEAIAQGLGSHGTTQTLPKGNHGWLLRDSPTAWRRHVRTFLGSQVPHPAVQTVP